jgi:hypothetical protein
MEKSLRMDQQQQGQDLHHLH